MLLTFLAPLISRALNQGDYIYSIVNGEATINGFNQDYSGALSITNTLGGYPVTSIGIWAFSSCTGLTSVTIPGSVTLVGDDAFCDCTGLTNLVIGSGVITIGDDAFSLCTNLTSVVIPSSVTSIGDCAFWYCPGLTNLVIGCGVITIGDEAFYSCTGLTSVTIPSSVTSIGDEAFFFCTGLTSVTIPGSVTTMSDRAFPYCSGLTNITVDATNPAYASADGVLFNKVFTTLIQCPGGKIGAYAIPSGVTAIGNDAFQSCTGLTAVTIPGSVTTIGTSAFDNCDALTTVTIPSSVTSIGGGAFCQCSGLTSVSIGTGVTSIGIGTFERCSSLISITVAAANANYSSANGVLFNKGQTELIQYPGGRGGNYTIPGGVASIGYSAFYFCTGLNSVTIPSSVTAIGDGAFDYCTGLTSVLFQGTPPTFGDLSVFELAPATIYYLPAFASTWPSTFAYCPTRLWNPTVQRDAGFGFAAGRFSFNLSGTPEIPVKVEATTNLAFGVWVPVTNANLNASGSLSFTDPASASLPARFYRIVFP